MELELAAVEGQEEDLVANEFAHSTFLLTIFNGFNYPKRLFVGVNDNQDKLNWTLIPIYIKMEIISGIE